MALGSMISAPAQSGFPVARQPSFSRGSPLNPRWKTFASLQTIERPSLIISLKKNTETIRTHLSNLEKLLQKEPAESDFDVQPPPGKKPRSVLEGLNLAGIWPGSKIVEEMSPRNLNKLQRLLSRKSDYSPRNCLAGRWKEYHGRDDWDGLLDPLDENLRREIVRYGEFVQGAYHTFHSDPATPPDSAPPPRQVSVPDRSFRVTKSLYATSSVGLPGWVDNVAPDLGWMTQRSSWVGYVAVCDNEREIQRMGRRDIVIALRGTATCLEWAENARAGLVQVPSNQPGGKSKPKVECGFQSLYKTRGAHVPSLSESIVEEIKRLMEQYEGEQLSITVTGHSLGAALALLVADELSLLAAVPPIAVISFGGPRVGNRGFAARVRDNGVKVLRVVNARDMITRVPGVGGGDEGSHVLDDMPWAYSHVGMELRVDSKSSPFLKPDADVACCHDLEAYLHLVDGFVAAGSPFRDNARRPIWRLLNEQSSNVKKLYTRKAKDLTVNIEKVGFPNVNYLASPS